MEFRKEHKVALVGMVLILGIYFFVLFSVVSSPNVRLSPESANDCSPNWSCSKWIPQECSSGVQRRSCIDVNMCNDSSDKPPEERECSRCEPNWVCSEWEPENCTEKGQVLTRDCEDTNDCGVSEGKPSEERKCELKGGEGMTWKYVALALIVLAIPVIVLIVVFFSRYYK